MMDPTGVKLATDFQKTLSRFKPADASEEILHTETMAAYGRMVEFRSKRIQNTNAGIPTVRWWVVALGALVNSILILFFRMRFDVHLVIGGLLSFGVGMLIFLIVAMDYPFRGEVSIGPDRVKLIYDALMKPAAAVVPLFNSSFNVCIMLSYVDKDCIEDSNEFEFMGLLLSLMSATNNSTDLV